MDLLTQLSVALSSVEDFLWIYLAAPAIVLLGFYLSVRSKFFQIRHFPHILKTFYRLLTAKQGDSCGVHPLKAFFACVGGCVGVGNIVAICTAVQIGGPGALFWIWITAIIGMLVKYSEVYLGLRFRQTNDKGGYNGGPMYFLQKVFKGPLVPVLVCLMLCVYGVEIYQFSIITTSIVTNFHVNQYLVIGILLALVIFAGSGGVSRVGNISSAIIPFFVLVYVGMGLWVLINNITVIPTVLADVFYSAFTGSAAVGAFAGSSIMLMVSHGVRRGCYTGDLGVGYASVIHSESNVKVPEHQASLVVFDIFLDTFIICTTSVMLILVTGVWSQPMDAGMMVQSALGQYFPYMNFFMPLFLFLLGYSTINAYFCVGIKCAEFLSPKLGRSFYYGYAVVVLLIFSFIDSTQAQSVMAIAGGLLLVVNCYGIFRLRHEISFNVVNPALAPAPAAVLVNANAAILQEESV